MIGFVKRHSDKLLAVGVVSVVGMLIIPLPTFLVDILLTFNIGAAVALLLTSTYIRNALSLSSLPSVLLLSTLFRLALNVSTTRLILLQADAGEVIDRFGSFVVGNNYIVGAVIFLILTLIQFIVIARGSERVAEVAARFSLDAMPGRQLAIDGDLRAGAIDPSQAQSQRRELQRESQLYGSMDGAMKFVKGDAIAGLVIIGINIGAGLLIGVLQLGMSLGEALEVFGLLTIGDGLVTQIPAILIATTAGVVVTRVSAADDGAENGSDDHLAAQIGAQFLAYPKALGITACLLAAFALLPGMPILPFLLLAVFIGLLAFQARRAEKPAETDDSSARTRVELLVSGALYETFAVSQNGFLRPLISALEARYGIKIGDMATRVSEGLDRGRYRILLDGIPLATGEIVIDALLVHCAPAELAKSGVPARVSDHPAFQSRTSWAPRRVLELLSEQDLPFSEPTDVIRTHVEQVLAKHLAEFVGVQAVHDELERLKSSERALVEAVAPKPVSIPQLTQVLKSVLDEGIPIRDLRRILEVLAVPVAASTEAETVSTATLVETVRIGLSRQISHLFAGEADSLSVFLVAPPIEDMIRSGLRSTDDGTQLNLPADISGQIMDALESTVSSAVDAGERPILVTRRDIRVHLKRLADVRQLRTDVLCFAELAPELALKSLGTVQVGRE